jgi:hypothetical protein
MEDFQKAYFIKLGRRGRFEEDCIKDGVLRLGFNNPYHDECLRGNFDSIRQWFEGKGKTKGVATAIVNQIRAFYESGEDHLWITFYQRKLWWAFAAPGIEQLEDGSEQFEDGNRIRKAVNGWKSTDVKGDVLSVDKISGRLTKVQMFRGTICEVKENRYLWGKINAIVSSDVARANKSLSELVDSALPLIKSLTWKDFELLVDLLFANAGWKRLGPVGGPEKDIDLDLMMPLNGRRAFVQIKSSSTQAAFDEYLCAFAENDLYDEMYFVVHTLKTALQITNCERPVTVINDKALSKLVVNSGMIEWLIEKAT